MMLRTPQTAALHEPLCREPQTRLFNPPRVPFAACHLGSPLASSSRYTCSIIRGRSFQGCPRAMSAAGLPSSGSHE